MNFKKLALAAAFAGALGLANQSAQSRKQKRKRECRILSHKGATPPETVPFPFTGSFGALGALTCTLQNFGEK